MLFPVKSKRDREHSPIAQIHIGDVPIQTWRVCIGIPGAAVPLKDVNSVAFTDR